MDAPNLLINTAKFNILIYKGYLSYLFRPGYNRARFQNYDQLCQDIKCQFTNTNVQNAAMSWRSYKNFPTPRWWTVRNVASLD